MTDSTTTDGPETEATDLDEAGYAVGPRPLGDRTFGILLLVLGFVGFGASMWLAIEKYLVLVEPEHQPSCSINLFVQCGAAMESWQGALLGFPNPYLGLLAFPVVMTTGVVLLVGARLPRWYWLSLLAGTVLGQALIFFLMYTSFYSLVALCPACMVVWTIMWPLLWFQVVRGVQAGYLPAGGTVRQLVVGNRVIILVIGYVVAVAWLMVSVGDHLIASFA